MTTTPESLFPADYRSARRAFIAACEARGLDAITRVVTGVSGPDGKPLFMDSVALGPRDATRALLVIGGVHGVDGRFGAGIQTGLLRDGIAPPDGARLVMIHTLNPYGFAWDRWVNENNIDIDHNLIDHANPPEGVTQAGQYAHPDALFYGGDAPCWSARALAAVLTEDLSRVQRLAAIDCRTGPLAPGPLDRGLARLMPKAKVTYTVAAMETVPPTTALQALQRANWQDCFAPDDAHAGEIARALRDAFFIDTPEWTRAAWNFGRKAVTDALAALA